MCTKPGGLTSKMKGRRARFALAIGSDGCAVNDPLDGRAPNRIRDETGGAHVASYQDQQSPADA
jgi:hypothetical protein